METLAGIILAAGILVDIVCGSYIFHEVSKDNYQGKAIVQAVHGECVRVKTPDGNLWDFFGEDFEVGQDVTIVIENREVVEAK